jgi:hypothetical protein
MKVKAQLAWFVEEFKSWLFSCSFRKVWHKFKREFARSPFLFGPQQISAAELTAILLH